MMPKFPADAFERVMRVSEARDPRHPGTFLFFRSRDPARQDKPWQLYVAHEKVLEYTTVWGASIEEAIQLQEIAAGLRSPPTRRKIM